MENYEKKYKLALNRIKVLIANVESGSKDCISIDDIQEVYPELKESEDEKIRKWCISHFKECINVIKDNDEYKEYLSNKVLAWLENQGEQKPADKVESKFHEGNWVFIEEIKGFKNGPFQIKSVDSFGYSFDEYHTIPFMYEDLLSKWTIQDAKAGDVLASNDGHGNDSIELIKSITGKKIEFWFCLTNGNRNEVFDGITPYTNFASREDATPATKEQRDQLEKAMADAGYTFDFEKKELKKIEQKPVEWSEQDERKCNNIIALVEGKAIMRKDIKGLVNWLKSLKDRVQLQPRQEWSEDDEEIRKSIIDRIEWRRMSSIGSECAICENQINWLKSLSSQSHWKPSDEQMAVLNEVINYAANSELQHWSNSVYTLLKSLHEQLKKLREE